MADVTAGMALNVKSSASRFKATISEFCQLQDINVGWEKDWRNHSRFKHPVFWSSVWFLGWRTQQQWARLSQGIFVWLLRVTGKTTGKQHFSVWHLKRFCHFFSLQVVAAGGIQMMEIAKNDRCSMWYNVLNTKACRRDAFRILNIATKSSPLVHS